MSISEDYHRHDLPNVNICIAFYRNNRISRRTWNYLPRSTVTEPVLKTISLFEPWLSWVNNGNLNFWSRLPGYAVWSKSLLFPYNIEQRAFRGARTARSWRFVTYSTDEAKYLYSSVDVEFGWTSWYTIQLEMDLTHNPRFVSKRADHWVFRTLANFYIDYTIHPRCDVYT